MKVEVRADAEKFQLYINDKLEATEKLGRFRSHGNGRVTLGGKKHIDYVPYRGLMDELVLCGW